MTEPEARESLYGNEPVPPAPQPPSLMDQAAGVFTEPVTLFQRLRATPVWGGAFALLLLLNAAVTLIWGARVDLDAFLRPMLEKNPKMTAEMIDHAIAGSSNKIIMIFGTIQMLVAVSVVFLLLALVYWIVAKVAPEEAGPRTYRQAFSATVVSSLVGLPKAVLLGIICALRTVGGLRPDQLSPTSLGFYLVPENPKLYALYCNLDLFTLAALGVTWLALRHTLRVKAGGAWAAVVILAAFMVGLPVLLAK